MASTVERPLWGVFSRPRSETGLWSWITTVDHKRIGILYFWTSLIMFLIGGAEALLIRAQLAAPDLDLVSAETFNQLFTMHGTTMIFLAIMPMTAAFFNYFIPLMIGARDVAFPKLNAFSYWMYLNGAIMINLSWILGGASNAGWFGYPNLSLRPFNPGLGVDFWSVGLVLAGVGTLVASFNFIVTILNMRAPGMSLMRMPVFAWATLVTQFLIAFAFPVITVALILVFFDRMYGTVFFDIAAGADLTVYLHLFWIFGHPEVYIIILPAMGIVSEIIPTFSRKPLFGYAPMVFATILIGFVGFGVWSHHLFTVGMGPTINTIFAVGTMIIAVPTGIKMFNWIGTLYGGQLRFTSPMLYALGFLALFLIGGLTGIMLGSAPSNAQLHHTYFVIGHFHYVMIGGALFSLMAAIHYWVPKMFGRMMNEKLGKISFWILFIGFNLTFFPMHLLGILGMPRRIFTYTGEMGWNGWNFASTVGAFMMAIAILLVLHNLYHSLRSGERAPADPWDGRTLEWTLPSPVPDYNFSRTPTVHSRDDFWYQKHPELLAGSASGEAGPGQGAADTEPEDIYLPGPSIMPFIASCCLTLGAWGLLYSVKQLAIFGFTLGFFAFVAWVAEGDGWKLVRPEEARS